jgi:hypothetical protein
LRENPGPDFSQFERMWHPDNPTDNGFLLRVMNCPNACVSFSRTTENCENQDYLQTRDCDFNDGNQWWVHERQPYENSMRLRAAGCPNGGFFCMAKNEPGCLENWGNMGVGLHHCEQHAEPNRFRVGVCDYSGPSKEGQWEVIMDVPNFNMTVEYSTCTEHSQTETETETWGESMTEEYSVGFSAFGATSSFSVSGTSSREVSSMMESSLTETTCRTLGVNFGDRTGVVWQWRSLTNSSCGVSVTSSGVPLITRNRNEPPCCLPTYFEDTQDPHGACIPDRDGNMYNLCE